jgi:hypothetical protein
MDYNFFNQDLHPREFKITFEPIGQQEFLKMVTCIASFPVETQMGRRFYFIVKNHDYIIGFIRINSPVICLSNRNNLFGTKLTPANINQHMLNGSVIVPVQPAGFNFLGGKLLTLICICNEMSELLRQKTTDYCYFETSSLYGSLKPSSQYDGMKPFVRGFGLTQSELLMYPHTDIFNELRRLIEPAYGIPEFNGRVTKSKSSPKQIEFKRLIAIIGENLKVQDKEKYEAFQKLVKEHMRTKTQKGYYYSNLGYANVKEHIITGAPLIEDNRSRFDFENLFAWWLKKATNRYENLKAENIFRYELEDYRLGTVIDMIR